MNGSLIALLFEGDLHLSIDRSCPLNGATTKELRREVEVTINRYTYRDRDGSRAVRNRSRAYAHRCCSHLADIQNVLRGLNALRSSRSGNDSPASALKGCSINRMNQHVCSAQFNSCKYQQEKNRRTQRKLNGGCAVPLSSSTTRSIVFTSCFHGYCWLFHQDRGFSGKLTEQLNQCRFTGSMSMLTSTRLSNKLHVSLIRIRAEGDGVDDDS